MSRRRARPMGPKAATVIAVAVAIVLAGRIMLQRGAGTATEAVSQTAVGQVHAGSLSVRSDRPVATGTPVNPALFNAGSCVTFPPDDGPDSTGETVFLDAGHGGMDPGGVGVTITDPFEASVADSVRGQRLIADGIAKAVGQYFSG